MRDPFDAADDPTDHASDGSNVTSGRDSSTAGAEQPTMNEMAAIREHDVERGPEAGQGRRRSWLLGLAPDDRPRATPAGVPDPGTLSAEIDDLRQRLAAAEKRAAEAETALPHLLALGQRTVNGLLDDARARAKQIIDAARERTHDELTAQRELVRRESTELQALRMAVAAEAASLEELRADLQRRISLAGTVAPAADDFPVDLIALEGARPAASPTARPVDPPAGTTDAGVGIIEASTSPAPSVEAQLEIDATALGERPVGVRPNPSSGFADAWDQDEDDTVAEAFDRFFTAEVDSEPSREWILADDTKP
ncbi:MAG: hypothetical protein JJE52_04085 [Acidimicrobiia bacterium]|nr:hypothetical protein [Acidimicrobiia bacterium]